MSSMKYFECTADNFEGRILPMLTEAGFGGVKEAKRVITFFGPIAFYQVIKGA